MAGLQLSKSGSVCLAGKKDGSICPEDAVWTLDLISNTWDLRHVTGDLPPQAQTLAFTVENNHGYVLVHEEAPVMGLRIYELDLQSWQWLCVPGLNIDFQLDPDEDTIATALIQVQDATCMVNPCCRPLSLNMSTFLTKLRSIRTCLSVLRCNEQHCH